MTERGSGLIANISSSGAVEYAWHVAYGVGKAALDRLTADRPLYTNRLILQDSPYLMQHAHNPVVWYPWG